MNKLSIQPWDDEDIVTCAQGLSDNPYTVFLDSNRATHPLNRWSFLCYDPVETIETKNGIITHNSTRVNDTDFFEFLQSRLNEYNFETDVNIPFIGGAVGYFGYDLGRQIEALPDNTEDILNAPDACIGIYTNLLAHDHHNNKTWLIGSAPKLKGINSANTNDNIKFTPQISDEEFKKNIQTVIDYIYAGEIYQANLSRLYTANLPENFNGFTHYKKLRDVNAAPYSAYMNFGDMQILSCSPEQFLSVKNKIVETRPIKGTLPSNQNADVLKNSDKDRAENIMIVDLLRNDLSKTCEHNSVKVDKLCDPETFEGLHHLVSTVAGELKLDNTAFDLLKSCFPGGSITGAPKIRAQEIIEELELTKRGPYCGAMVYIGFNGNMDTNIAIRTLIIKDNTAHLNLGSGIVSDSDPQKELEETYTKGRKIFESFEA